ncbi:hypothetical protein ACLHDG_09035 [Sulfurovum sp. CS9]|uniref:hypothetical protein n=1 Tax=Sulfurovum sp. CS9 TaxID=3391146 RepID=UPI0039E75B34
MNRPELLAEKKRTEIYLADMKINTPSVILQQSTDYKTAQDHLARLNDELLKITKQEEKAAKAEAKKKEESYKILMSFKDRLADMAEEVEEVWGKLDHTHRGAVIDIKNSLAQVLRGHTSSKKSA